MNLPRVLIIDDQLGSDAELASELRDELMEELGLVKPGAKRSNSNAIAEVVFCSGQIKTNGKVKNDYSVIHDAVGSNYGSHTDWAIVLLDVQFDSGKIDDGDIRTGLPGDDSFGEKVRHLILMDFPDLPVVMLTSKHQSELQDDEYPYISKVGLNARNFSHNLVKYGRLTNVQKKSLLGLDADVVACSPLTLDLFLKAHEIAISDKPVLILGESGSGKEVLAQYIHNQSDRRGNRFEAINVAAIPSELVEFELFGVEARVATGVDRRIGKFEIANGGTLFLDEIGDMPLPTQAKVLRVLQEYKITRVGGREPIHVNVRVLSATSRNIPLLLSREALRFDLLRRISPPTLTVPPLRERKEDIIPIVETYLAKFSSQYNKVGIKLGQEAKKALFAHPFFGNVGELQYVTHHLVVTIGNNRVVSGKEMSDALASSLGATVKVPTIPVSDLHEPFAISTQETYGFIADSDNLNSVEDLKSILEKVKIPADRDKLDGVMKTIEESYNILIKLVIGAALKATQGNDKRYKYSAAMFLLLGMERSQNELDDNAINENAKKTTKVKRMLCQILGISETDLAKNKQILATLVEQYEEYSRSKS